MKNNIFKVLGGLLLIFILSIIGLIGYSFIFEKESIKIDEYNFSQLKLVDEIIMNDQKYEYLFRDLKDFNRIYGSDIKPIKNCYYITDSNGDEKYIFGFKLESLLYKMKYRSTYIAYPSYQQPKSKQLGHLGRKIDMEYTDNNFIKFMEHISNPCDEDYL